MLFFILLNVALGATLNAVANNPSGDTIYGSGTSIGRHVTLINSPAFSYDEVRYSAQIGLTRFPTSSDPIALRAETTGPLDKADFLYDFPTPYNTLAQLSAASFYQYRSSASNVDPNIALGIRFGVFGTFPTPNTGGLGAPVTKFLSLVYEPYKQTIPVYSTANTDQWILQPIDDSSLFWRSDEPNTQVTQPLSAWKALSPNAEVWQMTTGAGSGWGGGSSNLFIGAVRDIQFTINGATSTTDLSLPAGTE